MKAVMPLLPVFNHRLGLAYVAATLRRQGHEVIPIDLEHILRLCDSELALDLQDETEVYAERWSRQIQYFHRPELLFGALFENDRALREALSDGDRQLIDRLRPHVRRWCDAILAFEPDLLLLPALVSNLWIVLWVAAEIGASSRIFRLLGGRGAGYPEVTELVLRARWIDGVVTGEAERHIAAVVEAVPRGARDRPSIPGFSYLSDGRLVTTPPDGRVDLDTLPLPDLQGLPFPGASLRLYSESGRDFHDATSLSTSRWCPYRCSYCYESIVPKNYRRRAIDAVVSEIEIQRGRHGTPRLFFCDSTLNVSPGWLRGLAEAMAALSWKPHVVFAHCEPTRLTADLCDTLRAAGFDKLNFGVESLDDRTLERMDRRMRVEDMGPVFTAAVEAGISLGLNVIANYPGETDAEFRATLAGVRELAAQLGAAASHGAGVRLMVSQARIDPHSSLYVNHERFGVRIVPRRLPVPESLVDLRPLLESLALEWTDGVPQQERHARFTMLRTYAESLSWPPAPRSQSAAADTRVAIDPASVPAPIAALLPASCLSASMGAGRSGDMAWGALR